MSSAKPKGSRDYSRSGERKVGLKNVVGKARVLLRPVCWWRTLWWSKTSFITSFPTSGHLYQDEPEYTVGNIVYQPGHCMTCGKSTYSWYNKFDPPLEF